MDDMRLGVFVLVIFVFWVHQEKKIVLWVLQSNLGDCLNLIMFFQWRPNEMREREGSELRGRGG